MRREMFDRHRRLRPKTYKAMRDERPIWARHYRGKFCNRSWYKRKIKKRNRPRIEEADRHDTMFIRLKYGSWRAREELWPSLRW
jgi:hypothetical protein